MSKEKTCKECSWLAETKFVREGKMLYYCNNLYGESPVERHKNFKICGEFNKLNKGRKNNES